MLIIPFQTLLVCSRAPRLIWCICLRRDMMANIKRVAKKIQGGLPIVGLLSRLSAPGGGFDEIVSGLNYVWGSHQPACWTERLRQHWI
jgi:hypothetical protein